MSSKNVSSDQFPTIPSTLICRTFLYWFSFYYFSQWHCAYQTDKTYHQFVPFCLFQFRLCSWDETHPPQNKVQSVCLVNMCLRHDIWWEMASYFYFRCFLSFCDDVMGISIERKDKKEKRENKNWHKGQRFTRREQFFFSIRSKKRLHTKRLSVLVINTC